MDFFLSVRRAVEEVGREKLARSMGLSEKTITRILKRQKTHSLNTLDTVYEYLGLDKTDEVYKEALRLSYKDTGSLFGMLFRKHRERMNLTLEEASAKTKVSRRTILRIETGERVPSISSDNITLLMAFYSFDEEERLAVKLYCDSTFILRKCVKRQTF